MSMNESYMILNPAALKEQFHSKGLTHATVAQHLGVSSKTVQRWVNGYVTRTSSASVTELARILNCAPQDICTSPLEIQLRPPCEILNALLSQDFTQIFQTPKQMNAFINVLQKYEPGDLPTSQRAILKMQLGYLKYKAGQYRAAKASLEEAIELAKLTKNIELHIRAQASLCAVLKFLGKHEQALAILESTDWENIPKFAPLLSEIEYRKASLLTAQNDLESAELQLKKSLLRELRSRPRTSQSVALKYIQLARIQLRQGRFFKAAHFYKRAETHAHRAGGGPTEAVAHYGQAIVAIILNQPQLAEQEHRKARLLAGGRKGVRASQKLLQIEFIFALYRRDFPLCQRIIQMRYKLNRHSPPLIVDTVKQALLLEKLSEGKIKVRPSWFMRAHRYMQHLRLSHRMEQFKKIESLPIASLQDFTNRIEFLVL